MRIKLYDLSFADLIAMQEALSRQCNSANDSIVSRQMTLDEREKALELYCKPLELKIRKLAQEIKRRLDCELT